MVFEGWPAKATVWGIKLLVLLHDIVTLPIYLFLDKPWKTWKANRIIWAKLEDENDPYSCYVRQEKAKQIDIETMDKLFQNSVETYGERRCFGIREVLGEDKETLKSGKVFKKLSMGKYKWISYNEVYERVNAISRGFLSIGVESKTPVAVFAENRVEWMLTAQALFRINAPLVTLYATLGEDGIVHSINETEVKYLVTSVEQLPKIQSNISKLPNITHIICMEGLIKDTKIPKDGIPDNIEFILYSELENRGRQYENGTFTPPASDDLAIIMYTSGSTGVPKGVMVTHRNVIACVKGFGAAMKHDLINEEEPDTYIAYLPAAHVLELASECYLSSLGVQVGFSTPQTLTDFSTAIKKGEKGDLTELKPTLMVAVPLMLDRIRNSILQLAGKEGTFTRLMFDFAVRYKKFWSEIGFETPRLNRKLLKTYRDFMGGELRVLFCGSAPLSSDTQSFIRCCLNVKVMQGYGLTETAACATAMHYEDVSYGRVGAPLSTCRLRLVDWEEGKYFVTDKPNPRGEIVVGGECLTLGYYKNEEATKDAYKIENGQRWFYTGDIGEVFPDGTLKIIDRKKDLVKLQFGEYIALGKVEAELKTSPLVENICVVGTIELPYLIALVIPNQFQLKLLAKDLGKENLSYEEMCYDDVLVNEVTELLKHHAKKCQLKGAEIPKKIRLISDDWVPESGLVTAAFKLRRKFIENRYQDIIKSMHNENVQNGPHSR